MACVWQQVRKLFCKTSIGGYHYTSCVLETHDSRKYQKSLRTHLAALLWTISNMLMCCWVLGSILVRHILRQGVLAFCMLSDGYWGSWSLCFFSEHPVFGYLQNIHCVCGFDQFRSLLTLTPKYLAQFTDSNTWTWMVYWAAGMVVFDRLSCITVHLLGLLIIISSCASHCCNVSKSCWRTLARECLKCLRLSGRRRYHQKDGLWTWPHQTCHWYKSGTGFAPGQSSGEPRR